MQLSDIPWHPERRVLRQFGLLLALLLAGGSVLLVWRGTGSAWAWGAGVASGLAALAAWRRPAWLRVLYVGLIVATFPVGWLVTQGVLLFVYFGMLLPVALFYRVRGRDELRLRPPTEDDTTFWEPKTLSRDRSAYRKQF